MTQSRTIISARVIPWDCLEKALRVSTWPTNATYTVTNDISMVLAKRFVKTEAVEGMMLPREDMAWPHPGFQTATTNQAPLMTVE
jgi:hypothetical protein